MEQFKSSQNEAAKVVDMQQTIAKQLEFIKTKSQEALHNDLVQRFIHIENLYKRIPYGYHLDVEVTPHVYDRLGGENKAWLRQDERKLGTEFFIKVDRKVDDASGMDPDKSVLNLVFLGGAVGTRLRFGLIEKSRDTAIPHKSFLPEEVVGMTLKKS